MRFASFAAIFLAIAPAFSQHSSETHTIDLTYNQVYDDSSLSLYAVACSNGTNGLINQGYSTLGTLPNFPYVGGVYTVEGWDSSACGTCYYVAYGDTTTYVLAVDTASDGLNLSEEAMNALTNGQAAILGNVQVLAFGVDGAFCGM